MQKLYDAIVRHDPLKGLSIVFTPAGATRMTDERYDAFDTACGQRIRKIPSHTGEITVEGYFFDAEEPLLSMWALAHLVHEHFQIEVDVIPPR